MARILDQAQNTRVDTKTDASAESPCVAVPITPASSPDATSRTDTPSILQPDDQAAPSSISSPAVLPTASPQYQLLGGMITWGNIGKLLLGIPSVAKPLSVLIALTFASLIAYAEFTGQRVVIEPFEVPSHLRDSGFTSRTIANKLTDHITSIRGTARTSMRRQQFVSSSSEPSPQVLALGGGVSVDSVFQYIREFLGREPVRIVGEIVTTRSGGDGTPQVQVTTRVKGRPPKTISGSMTSLDALLLQSAEHIFLHTQPYVLASYLYEFDPKRCLEAIQYVLQNDPPTDDARAFNLWGILSLDAGDLEGAVDRFREAVRVSTEGDIRARAFTNWATALRRQKRYEEALAKVQKAIEADATHAEAYHVWGLILAALEQASTPPADAPPAMEKFSRAIEVNPRFIPAYFSLGEELEKRNELLAAIQHYRRGVDLDRRSVVGRVRLARALMRANEIGEARQHLERATELDPKSLDAHSTLGIALMKQGDLRTAAARFSRAKELAPKEPSSYFNMGLIYRMGGDRQRAVQEFREYLNLSPQGPGADQARRFLGELQAGASAPR